MIKHIYDGNFKGMITIKDIEQKGRFPNAVRDARGRFLVGAAVGPKDLDRAQRLVKAEADALFVDTAHGHSQNVLDGVRRLKKEFGVPVIAGNIATETAAEDLIAAGADAIKIGVGPGSICFEAGTLVTMADYSAKKIEDVSVGDYVVTHNNRKRIVTKKYVRNHTGKMCEINVNGSPGKIMVTPNHPLLGMSFDSDPEKILKYGAKYYFAKRKYNHGLGWIEAGMLKKGDVVAVPRTTIRKPKEMVFDLAEFVPNHLFDETRIWSNKIGFNPNEESHVDLAEKFNTTPRVIANVVHGGRSVDMNLNRKVNQYLESVQYTREIESNKVNRFVKLDENLMKLFGYFIAEGYVSGAKNNRQLCFSFSKYETGYHEEVVHLASQVFGYPSSKVIEHKTRNSAVVHVFSHIIASFFERIFPLGAKNKRVPAIVLEQDDALLKSFVRGAWNGDGTVKEDGRASYKTLARSASEGPHFSLAGASNERGTRKIGLFSFHQV